MPSYRTLPDLNKDTTSFDVRVSCESSVSPSNGLESRSHNGDYQARSDYANIRRDDVSAIVTEKSAPSSANVPLIARGERSINNKRIYGTVCPKTTFDVFARAVTASWAAAPSSEDSPTKIRQYAKPAWQGQVTLDQKDEWYKIYEARKDPFVDLTAMGVALLLSQSLLSKVVPGDRLAAAKLFCQQHQKKASATSSFQTVFAKTPVPSSPPDASPIESAPVATNPVHQEELSGMSWCTQAPTRIFFG